MGSRAQNGARSFFAQRDWSIILTIGPGFSLSEQPGGARVRFDMAKIFTSVARVAAIGLTGLALAGCGYTPEQRAASGGLIGAGTGAAIAGAAGGGPGAVIASSLLGAGAGALIGANTRPAPPPVYVEGGRPPPIYVEGGRPPPRCAEFAEDAYGRPYCRTYYGY